MESIVDGPASANASPDEEEATPPASSTSSLGLPARSSTPAPEGPGARPITPTPQRFSFGHRRRQPDFTAALSRMQDADHEILTRVLENSNQQIQLVLDDIQESRRREEENERRREERAAAFHEAFLNILGQMVQTMGGRRNADQP